MSYYNINTKEEVQTRPSQLAPNQWNPKEPEYLAAGWREITSIEQPPEGFRVNLDGYLFVENEDGTTCKKVPDPSKLINIADEQAAADAAEAQRIADQEAADAQAVQDQINMDAITAETLKGFRDALLTAINAREPFVSNPITPEEMSTNMTTCVTTQISNKKPPINPLPIKK